MNLFVTSTVWPLGYTWMVKWFSLLSLSLNLAIWSLSSDQLLVLFLLTVQSFSIFSCKEYNQSDFSIDHLVMFVCRVISCVVGRECLLWPVCSLGKTVSFCLLHFVLQGQTCLLLQVFLDFLLLHSSPPWCKGHLFLVLVLEGLVGLYRTVQLHRLWY